MKLGQLGSCTASAAMLKNMFSPDSSDMSFRFVGPSETPAGSGQFSCRKRLNSVLSLDDPVAPSLTQTLDIQTPFKLSPPYYKIQGNILKFPKENPAACKHPHFLFKVLSQQSSIKVSVLSEVSECDHGS